jgi:hypothetical protein
VTLFGEGLRDDASYAPEVKDAALCAAAGGRPDNHKNGRREVSAAAAGDLLG